MARTVQPKYNFKAKESGDTLVFEIKTFSRARTLLGILGGVAVVAGMFCGLLALMNRSISTGQNTQAYLFSIQHGISYESPEQLASKYTALAIFWVIVGVVLFMATNLKRTSKIIFGKDSITVRGKEYLVPHINYIGYDSVSNAPGLAFASGVAGTVVASVNMLESSGGQYIYITYGTERVPIITGITPQHVEQIYDRIVAFLARFGHHFGSK